MKAIFITYNQALTERVHAILDENEVRGYTKWELTTGRGSEDGEPHLGTHAWPSMNSSILAITKKSKVKTLLEALREMDSTTSRQGSRAFTWDIEEVS